ncbi:MAG: DUF2480 family protein [Maribacter sp.]
MSEEIINRVAQSQLITIDLEDYYPKGERVLLDIKDWLFEDIVLREKEFRTYIAEHDWSQYQSKYVAIYCSTDAIVPGWAYMLVATKLQPFTKNVVKGSLQDLETSNYQTIIANLDLTQFTGKPVIIKGCSNKPVPQNAYLWITQKLLPIAKSVMYGEACSSVPLFKKQ